MYYMKLRDGGELWAGLPKNIIEEIRGPVLRVWLGSGGAHVIEKEPGQLIWNLMGRYGELSDILDKYKARGIEVGKRGISRRLTMLIYLPADTMPGSRDGYW